MVRCLTILIIIFDQNRVKMARNPLKDWDFQSKAKHFSSRLRWWTRFKSHLDWVSRFYIDIKRLQSGIHLHFRSKRTKKNWWFLLFYRPAATFWTRIMHFSSMFLTENRVFSRANIKNSVFPTEKWHSMHKKPRNNTKNPLIHVDNASIASIDLLFYHFSTLYQAFPSPLLNNIVIFEWNLNNTPYFSWKTFTIWSW